MSSQAQANLPPALQMSQMIVGLWVPQAVHAAAELGIADVLAEKPLPSRVVAERLETHPDATERLLKALVTLGLVAPHEDGFELTDLGRCLETRAQASRRAWSRLMGGAEVWRAWGRLTDCIRTGRKAYGSSDGAGSSESDTFDVLAADPAGAAIFHQAMADLTSGVAPGIARAIDIDGTRRVVDVGGGYGALLCALLEAHPSLEGTVFDLEHARDGATELFASHGVASRASYVAGSFFETAPPKADLYVLKSVIHDWDDARGLRILGRCREAMGDKTRLLLVEPPAGSASGNPVGDWFLTFSDLNMLVNTGGRERTEAEYSALLEAAKLRVRGCGRRRASIESSRQSGPDGRDDPLGRGEARGLEAVPRRAGRAGPGPAEGLPGDAVGTPGVDERRPHTGEPRPIEGPARGSLAARGPQASGRSPLAKRRRGVSGSLKPQDVHEEPREDHVNDAECQQQGVAAAAEEEGQASAEVGQLACSACDQNRSPGRGMPAGQDVPNTPRGNVDPRGPKEERLKRVVEGQGGGIQLWRNVALDQRVR